jgi:hypothetical protein
MFKSLSELLNFSLLSTLLTVGLTAFSFPVAGWAQDRPVETDDSMEVILPLELRPLFIENPYVTFLVDVGDDGTLFDVLPTESNHYELLPHGLKIINAAIFKPALENGQPTRSRSYAKVRFYDPEQRAWESGAGGAVFGGNVSDAVRRRIYSTSKERFIYGLSEVDDLDNPLERMRTKLRVYSSKAGGRAKGKCLVEFYIDASGQTRFPEVIKSDSVEVSLSAALTLKETTFTPPQRNGQPTYVKIREEFMFP